MTTTPDLGIPELAQSQATPEITHNEALILFQALLNGVINATTTAPPGSPTEGDSYIVGAAATGAWSGYDNHIAIFYNGSWDFVPGVDDSGTIITMDDRKEGLRIWDRDTAEFLIWNGSPLAWNTFAGGGGAVDSVFGRTGVVVADPGDYNTLDALNVTGQLDVDGATFILDAFNYNGVSTFFIRSRFNGGLVQIGTETSGGVLYYPIRIDGANDTLRLFNDNVGEMADFDTNGNFTVDTDTFFVDAVNDRIGVNENAPSVMAELVSSATDNAIVDIKDGSGAGTAAVSYIQFRDSADLALGFMGFVFGTDHDMVISNQQSANLKLRTGNSDRVIIDSSGFVGVGGQPVLGGIDVITTTSSRINLAATNASDTHEMGSMQFDSSSNLSFQVRSNTGAFLANSYVIGHNSSGPTQHSWRIGSAEEMKLDSNGNLLVGKSTASSPATVGLSLENIGLGIFTRDSNVPIIVNRNTNDGTLVSFRQDNSQEGTISVSGTTVSYNGGHLSRWSQLSATDKTDPTQIPRGTVMQGLDEMCVWEGEDNEQLTRTKVCDAPGSNLVAGVFIRYDSQDVIHDPNYKRRMIPDTSDKPHMVPDPNAKPRMIPDPNHKQPMVQDPTEVWPRVKDKNWRRPTIKMKKKINTFIPDFSVKQPTMRDPYFEPKMVPDPRWKQRTMVDPKWQPKLIQHPQWKPRMIADPKDVPPFIPDPDYIAGDFFIAQTGDFIIRVTGPVKNGDLLESNGDGTARVQKDDIQRSSTIAKAALSFPNAKRNEENLVPCLLMLG